MVKVIITAFILFICPFWLLGLLGIAAAIAIPISIAISFIGSVFALIYEFRSLYKDLKEDKDLDKAVENKWSKMYDKYNKKCLELLRSFPDDYSTFKDMANCFNYLGIDSQYYYRLYVTSKSAYMLHIKLQIKERVNEDKIIDDLIQMYERLEITKIPLNKVKSWSYVHGEIGCIKIKYYDDNGKLMETLPIDRKAEVDYALPKLKKHIPQKNEANATAQKMNDFLK